MATYAEWNVALYEFLFPKMDQNQPVYFQVDEETLEELAAQETLNISAKTPVEDFSASVRNLCVSVGEVDLSPLQWGSTDPIPIQVSFLGLTVLAASMMESTDTDSLSVGSTNFYARINPLLGVPGVRKHPGFNNFVVEKLWLNLRRQLEEQRRGELQLSQGAVTRRYVWYPISQSLLSRQDCNKLHAFFSANKFPVFCPENTSIPHFTHKLAAWVAGSNMSARAKGLALPTSVRHDEFITRVRRELADWDGLGYTGGSSFHSRRNSAIELKLELSEGGGVFLSALIRRRPSFECRLSLERNTIGASRLWCDEPTVSYFDPITLPESFDLGEGLYLQAHSEKFKYSFQRDPRKVVVFRRDSRFWGSLVSCDRVALNEEACVAVCPSALQGAISILQAITGTEAAALYQGRIVLASGWSLFPRLRAIHSTSTTEHSFACLIPSERLDIELEGGVQLIDNGARRVFMKGRLPAIRLIGNWKAEHVIELDEVSLKHAGSGINLPELAEGVHTISYLGSRTLRFIVKTPGLGSGRGSRPRILKKNESGFIEELEEIPTVDDPEIIQIMGAVAKGPAMENAGWNSLSRPKAVPRSPHARITDEYHRAAIAEYKRQMSERRGYNAR